MDSLWRMAGSCLTMYSIWKAIPFIQYWFIIITMKMYCVLNRMSCVSIIGFSILVACVEWNALKWILKEQRQTRNEKLIELYTLCLRWCHTVIPTHSSIHLSQNSVELHHTSHWSNTNIFLIVLTPYRSCYALMYYSTHYAYVNTKLIFHSPSS